MTAGRNEKLIEQARALYAEGLGQAEIASALAVSARTISRWARRDAEAGRPWRRERAGDVARPPKEPPSTSRDRSRRTAERLRRSLEKRLARLVKASEADDDNGRIEDRMLKLCKVLEFLRADSSDLDCQLRTLERFTAFCLTALCDEEMDPVRKAVRMFMEQIRRESS